VYRACALLLALPLLAPALAVQGASTNTPLPVILDTDIGNDVNDVLALAMLHSLATEGRCNLLAVTISKDNRHAAPFVDAVNTFYGRGDIPIGVVHDGKTPRSGRFLRRVLAQERDGQHLFPRDLESGKDAPEAVSLLRQTLATQRDHSTTVVLLGFSTNLARLLQSTPDHHSPLTGRDLVQRKVTQLVMMAGQFDTPAPEYNLATDCGAAARVFTDWPTPIIVSGHEIGSAVHYPLASFKNDFSYTPHHPVVEAHRHFSELPHDQPGWDLTATLQAVEPDAGHFGLSAPGHVAVDASGVASFTPHPEGTVRHLTVTREQIPSVSARFVALVSSPPASKTGTPTLASAQNERTNTHTVALDAIDLELALILETPASQVATEPVSAAQVSASPIAVEPPLLEKPEPPKERAPYVEAEPPTPHGRKLAAFAREHAGDPTHGRDVFRNRRLRCAKCHGVEEDAEPTAGPNLANVGRVRNAEEIIAAILLPSRHVAAGYEQSEVTLKTGGTRRGIVVEDTSKRLVLFDRYGLRTILRRKDVQTVGPAQESLMPAKLVRTLSPEEFADLVAFLRTLRTHEKPGP
jgi:putative heme-binding domain-containing protein